MGILGECDSCGQLDLVRLYPDLKKDLCEECISDFELFAQKDDDDEECDHCGSPYHLTRYCNFNQEEA